VNAAEKPVILLVQEDARVRRLIQGCLAQSYRLVTASGLSDALGRALETKPDVVLSDQDDLVLSIRSVADLDRVPSSA
jgi:CheY-like chemotaxis protein